jgi:acetyltransferase-like isoleucine patch superfamily enzyme
VKKWLLRRRGNRLLTMGRHSYGKPYVRAYRADKARVSIGNFVSIAEEVTFLVGGEHRPEWVTTFPLRAMLRLPGAWADGHPATRGEINVGHDVWIARGSTILSGVTIGNGAVIGASSVVRRDVRPYAIVMGNPAREVKRRFNDEQVEQLEALRWWDWPDERIKASVDLLNGASVEEFLAQTRQPPPTG